jgi:hypothetical protein
MRKTPGISKTVSGGACVCAQTPAGQRVIAIAAAKGKLMKIHARHGELLAIFGLLAGRWITHEELRLGWKQPNAV